MILEHFAAFSGSLHTYAVPHDVLGGLLVRLLHGHPSSHDLGDLSQSDPLIPLAGQG